MALARFHPDDGSFDPGFGAAHDGRVTTDFGTDFDLPATDQIVSMAVDGAGKIVVLAVREGGTPNNLSDVFSLVRYRPTGELDETFQGIADLPISRPSALVIDSEGRIVVGGSPLVRYLSDGSLDVDFGDGGSVRQGILALAIDSRNRIIAAAERSEGRIEMVRYRADGALDTTFGGDGKVLVDDEIWFDDFIGLKVDLEDRILLGADSYYYQGTTERDAVAVVRYNVDGALDGTFGVSGQAIVGFQPRFVHFRGFAVDSKSRVVLCVRDGSDSWVARLTADGVFDNQFSANGTVLTRNFTPIDFLPGDGPLAIDSRDRVVIGGHSEVPPAGFPEFSFTLVRYRSDGSLDSEFDGNGRVVTNFQFARSSFIETLAIDHADRVIASGPVRPLQGDGSVQIMARYRSDGVLDTGFGDRGMLPSELHFSQDSSIQSIAIVGQERLLVGASLRVGELGAHHPLLPPPSFGNAGFGLVRYRPDGRVDKQFGEGGGLLIPEGGRVTIPEHAPTAAVAVDGLQRIVVASSRGVAGRSRFAVSRYTPDGLVDRDFGVNGTVVTPSSADEVIADVVIDSENRIVAAGYVRPGGSSFQFALACFRPEDGTLDPGFGTGGKVQTDLSGAALGISRLALDADDNILAVGSAFGPGHRFVLVRFTRNGTLDMSFGANGVVVTDFEATAGDRVHALIIDRQERILLGGVSRSDPSAGQWTLARYDSDGAVDKRFGNNGKVTTRFVRWTNEQVRALAIDSQERIIAGGFVDGILTLFQADEPTPDLPLEPPHDLPLEPEPPHDLPFRTGGIASHVALVVPDGPEVEVNPDDVEVNPDLLTRGRASALVRYLPDGQLDATFNLGRGIVQFGNNAAIHTVTVDQLDRIIAAGDAQPDN
jgi:uncharacterized delta-60 repeat protein